MQQSYQTLYEKKNKIGAGKYGTIFKVKRIKDGKQFVSKHVPLDSIEKKKALQQLQILKKLKHPYIVEYIDSFIEDEELIIIMQYCGQKDLAYHIQTMKKKNAHFNQHIVINWLLQLVLAMEFLYSKKILHRDIKPQNIFVDSDMNLKVGDFGISKILDSNSQQAMTVVGTPFYLAPEICSQQKYTSKADIWSLGCVLYQICSLQKPFQTKKGLIQLIQQIKALQVKPIPSVYCQDLQKIVKKMLTKDHKKRPNAVQLMKDPLLVQLMINNSSKVNLKKQYPNTIQKPTITQSFVEKQTVVINSQLKKFEEQIAQKMQQMKKKAVKKQDVDAYYLQVKQKMKQIEKAVKSAFTEIKSKTGTDQLLQSSVQKSNLHLNTLKSGQLSDSSSETINSVVMSTNKKLQISEVESQMQSDANFGSTNNKKIDNSINLDLTLKSQYANTIKSVKSDETLNKLQALHKTIKQCPKAVLDSEFMNCSLMYTLDEKPQIDLSKREQDQLNFSLTKTSNQLNFSKSIGKSVTVSKQIQSGKQQNPKNQQDRISQKNSQQEEYGNDFDSYDEEQQNHRGIELKSIYSIYEQTLQQLNNESNLSKTQLARRKYDLTLSLIRQQSNQGGSTLTQNQET